MHADNLAWDPDYMGSSMMVPVVYVTWFMAVVFTCLLGKPHHPARTQLIWKALLLLLLLRVLLLLLLFTPSLVANHLLPVLSASLIDCAGVICVMLCGHLLHGSRVGRPDKRQLPPDFCIMSLCCIVLGAWRGRQIAQVHKQCCLSYSAVVLMGRSFSK